MESIHDGIIRELHANAKGVFTGIDDGLLKEAVSLILNSQKVFVLGMGHAGVFGAILSMRLNQAGVRAYTVFDGINPPLEKDDLFVAISQSGETETVVSIAAKAKRLGGRVLGITSNGKSALGKLSDIFIEMGKCTDDVSFPTLSIIGDEKHENMSGVLFGFNCYVLVYTLIIMIMREKGETAESVDARHANLQ